MGKSSISDNGLLVRAYIYGYQFEMQIDCCWMSVRISSCAFRSSPSSSNVAENVRRTDQQKQEIESRSTLQIKKHLWRTVTDNQAELICSLLLPL